MIRQRKMILGAVARGIGSHVAAWRHPSVGRAKLREATTLKHWADVARAAEQGKMHFVFLADVLAMPNATNAPLLRRSAYDFSLEPMTLLSAMAPLTERIGLVGSISTTYSEPYNVARLLASLDHVSGGRAAWNVVTSHDPNSARNFGGGAFMEKGDRYERAQVFTRVVKGLWDSWEDDAFVHDQAGGVFVDPAKMHPLHHKSAHFQVEGPLNIERPPQGHPVIFVAGSSEGAKEVAAEQADCMFTAQPDFEEAKRFYGDVKGRMARYGRSPDDLFIIPGAMIVAGRTDEEAHEKHHRFKESIDLEFGILYLSGLVRTDLSHLPLDEPLPDSLRQTPAWSRLELVMDISRRGSMTFREIAIHYADTYGHQFIVGSPQTVADELQRLFEERAADGFVLRAPIYPEGVQEIVSLVIPELQRRGLAQTEYLGSTFRENLGLPRPLHPAMRAAKRAAAE
ncbi:MAG: LLM class flavin-dependent oxidoreductase [Reyranellaceae bacterium]